MPGPKSRTRPHVLHWRERRRRDGPTERWRHVVAEERRAQHATQRARRSRPRTAAGRSRRRTRPATRCSIDSSAGASVRGHVAGDADHLARELLRECGARTTSSPSDTTSQTTAPMTPARNPVKAPRPIVDRTSDPFADRGRRRALHRTQSRDRQQLPQLTTGSADRMPMNSPPSRGAWITALHYQLARLRATVCRPD